MTATSLTDKFPNRFQRESLILINKLLALSSAAFYLVGPDMRHRGVVLHNMDVATERNYEENFRYIDPLRPTLFETSGEKVVCLDDVLGDKALKKSRYYHEFMVELGQRYVSDMFFRRDEKIVAVLSMIREESLGSYSKKELTLLNDVQPFLEYTLNSVYLPKRHQQRETIEQSYALTNREIDVVELVIAGASNKVIAKELGLSLATVKTHIQHVFQKMGVFSRTELSAQLLGQL